MAHSLSKLLIHLVFSTKMREDSIPDELLGELHGYVAGIAERQQSLVYRVGGTTNHVHVACTLARTQSVSSLAKELKARSSSWLKSRDVRCSGFGWQQGFAAFSLGQSQLPALLHYVENQAIHHGFKEELIELLNLYEVSFDETRLWN